jgi:hypothetical protein
VVLANTGGIDIGLQRLDECMVARHGVLFAAFLVQLHLPARTLRPEILDLHAQGRGDARERIGEGGDQRAVAQITHSLGRNACVGKLSKASRSAWCGPDCDQRIFDVLSVAKSNKTARTITAQTSAAIL